MESGNGGDRLRARFDANLRGLHGRAIEAVDYWDLHRFDAEPAVWDYGDWHHAVMGVQLGTDGGPVTVTWTSTFFPYGVEVLPDRIEDHLVIGEGGPERVGPDTEGVWTPRLGSPVRGTACHWERFEVGPSRRADGRVVGAAYSVDVPLAVRIDFDAGPVWFVAAIPQPPDMQDVFLPGDEIMVVFSHEKMRNMGFDDPHFLQSARRTSN